MHVSLSNDIKKELEEYSKTYDGKFNKSRFVREAIEEKLKGIKQQEQVSDRIKSIILEFFELPPGHTIRGFYINLVLLAAHYPDQSSQKYWASVYKLTKDFTHKQILRMIKEKDK